MATSKQPAKNSSTAAKKAAPKPASRNLNISIDLDALDKLYRQRYVVVLDGGDTKGGGPEIRRSDGDTKGGLEILDRGRPVEQPAARAPRAARASKKKS